MVVMRMNLLRLLVLVYLGFSASANQIGEFSDHADDIIFYLIKFGIF